MVPLKMCISWQQSCQIVDGSRCFYPFLRLLSAASVAKQTDPVSLNIIKLHWDLFLSREMINISISKTINIFVQAIHSLLSRTQNMKENVKTAYYCCLFKVEVMIMQRRKVNKERNLFILFSGNIKPFIENITKVLKSRTFQLWFIYCYKRQNHQDK